MGAGTAGLGLAASAGSTRGVSSVAEETPLFRFVQLNDVHVAYDNRNTYSKAREKFEAVSTQISHGEQTPRPDLIGQSAPQPDVILSVGDIANGDERRKLLPDNEEAAALLRQIGIPVLPTPGNHEVLQGEGDPVLEQAYARAFGEDLTTYAVFFRGILFVMVNNAGGRARGDAVSDRRNAIVADLLERHPDMPKIIACHIPLVPFREPKTLAESFGFTTWKLIGDGGLLPIVEKHRESVIAVLNGHLHLTGHVVVNDLHHICVSGIASYPCHYAEYEVYRNRIHVRMRQPLSKLITPLAGDIHSRKGVFHTDLDHPTHEQYVAGRPDEQEFDLMLTKKTRLRRTASLLALKQNGWPAPNCKTVPLSDTRTKVEDLGAKERVVCVPFRAVTHPQVYVTSADGKRLYLTPSGQDAWSSADLRPGVPILLPANGAAVLSASRREPAADVERVSTSSVLGQEGAK